MKTPQDNRPSELDEVEDLTLFADESFDTDDVDLFEFTGEDDSPLTRLKSIILSLDWEINDDILQELTDEIGELQHMWQGDKVARVYLQGLDKIGSYLRSEGAYAHPNAIKLLLTFYYNFEKIISSQNITGSTITSLLKADVRKFKILQYQINKSKPAQVLTQEVVTEDVPSGPEIVAVESEQTEVECEPLACLKATILGLEWEVTDKGLDQFNSQIGDVREHFVDDKSAQILIQGLQALGGYITDERAEAHPEAFSLLHSFYSGLEQLLQDETMNEEGRRNILVDQVSRLNNLKAIIADRAEQTSSQSIADDIIDEVLEPIDSIEDKETEEELQVDKPGVTDDSEDEFSFTFTEEDMTEDESPAAGPVHRAAMETSDQAYPDDVLTAEAISPVDDEVTDDFIAGKIDKGTKISPALVDVDRTDDIEERPDSEIEDELDLFFTDDMEDSFEQLTVDGEEKEEDTDALELSFSGDELDESPGEEVKAKSATSDAKDEMEQLFIEDDAEDDLLIEPALADAEDDGGFNEEQTVATLAEEPTGEIDDQLDAFFGASEEEEPVVEASQESEETVTEKEELLIEPALAGAEDDGGFNEEQTVATLAEEPTGEIDDKLDVFFGTDEEEEETVVEELEETVEEKEELLIEPALAGAEDEGGFNEEQTVATLTKEPTGEIDDKLDAFFGTDEEEPEPIIEKVEEEKVEVGSEGLQSLALSLAALSTKVTIDQLEEGKNLVQQLQQEPELKTEQAVLLQLLNSVLTLIPSDADVPPEGTAELTDYLYGHIEHEDNSSEILVTAIGRFTDWQKQLIQGILKSKAAGSSSATGVSAPDTLTHVTSEVHSGFDSLRSALKEEFASLRDELKRSES